MVKVTFIPRSTKKDIFTDKIRKFCENLGGHGSPLPCTLLSWAYMCEYKWTFKNVYNFAHKIKSMSGRDYLENTFFCEFETKLKNETNFWQKKKYSKNKFPKK